MFNVFSPAFSEVTVTADKDIITQTLRRSQPTCTLSMFNPAFCEVTVTTEVKVFKCRYEHITQTLHHGQRACTFNLFNPAFREGHPAQTRTYYTDLTSQSMCLTQTLHHGQRACTFNLFNPAFREVKVAADKDILHRPYVTVSAPARSTCSIRRFVK